MTTNRQGMSQEVTVGTVIQSKAQSNDDRTPRWSRTQRAELFDQYLNLQAQGFSLRQAAKALEVSRSTLQAWRTYQESLDEHPAVVVFFQSSPRLAFLHRLVLGIHLVCTEVGACGIRLVCLLLTLIGLDRFVAASYGIQQQVNRQVEEAIVRYRQEESARLAQDMPTKAITLAKDETFTGGLCLVAAEPKSNYIVLEQAAHARDQDTWQRLMEKALSGLHCQVMQSTGGPYLNIIPAQRCRVCTVRSCNRPAMKRRGCWPTWHITSAHTTRRTYSMCSMSWSKPSQVPWLPSSGRLSRRPARRKSGLNRCKGNFRSRLTRLTSAAQRAPPSSRQPGAARTGRASSPPKS